jgi:hypothetical protein
VQPHESVAVTPQSESAGLSNPAAQVALHSFTPHSTFEFLHASALAPLHSITVLPAPLMTAPSHAEFPSQVTTQLYLSGQVIIAFLHSVAPQETKQL